MPGIGKISNNKAKHVKDGHLNAEESILFIRILGVLELLGCIGILIPWFTGVAPILTPITAVGFSFIMISGIVVHTKKKEYKMLPMLIVVLALSLVVAYFRFDYLSL